VSARQRAQRLLQLGQAGVLTLDGANSEPVARQLLERQCAAADLADQRRFGHFVALSEHALERCPQPRRLRLQI